MLKAPPLLTIRRNFDRPSAVAIAGLAGTATAFLVDAQNGRGALDYRIKPLVSDSDQACRFAGVALTCHCGPADNLGLMAAVALAQPGDVLVVATDQFTGTCVTGDLTLGMARNRGVCALVTDGLVRDYEGIRQVGLPVFCRGLTPNSPVGNGPGTVGLPVTLGGVRVHAGDILVGDRDGVAVVPRQELDGIVNVLEEVKRAEAKMDEQVREGLEMNESITTLLQSDRVRYLD